MKKLTWAEEYVMGQLLEGQHPKEIAVTRGITITAVSAINRRVKGKLGARTTYQAVAMYAVEKAKK